MSAGSDGFSSGTVGSLEGASEHVGSSLGVPVGSTGGVSVPDGCDGISGSVEGSTGGVSVADG